MAGESRLSVTEWLNLTEIHVPTVRSVHETGATYHVSDIGLVAADPEECRRVGLPKIQEQAGEVTYLPTIVVDYGRERVLYRLPLVLSDWAFRLVAAPGVAKDSIFPADIQFRLISGHFEASVRRAESKSLAEPDRLHLVR